MIYTTPRTDAVAGDPVLLLATARELEFQLSAVCESHRIAMASWEEERQRALREAGRVIEANRLLDEAFGFVNPPLADAISKYLSQFNPSL